MAAARQKEMKVSITEDATISLTRSEGGAANVRLDAISMVSARLPAFWSRGAEILAALAESISESISSQSECWPGATGGPKPPAHSSFPNSSLASSTKLMSTTTVEPARPRKNITSSTRIAKTANGIVLIVPCFRPIRVLCGGRRGGKPPAHTRGLSPVPAACHSATRNSLVVLLRQMVTYVLKGHAFSRAINGAKLPGFSP